MRETETNLDRDIKLARAAGLDAQAVYRQRVTFARRDLQETLADALVDPQCPPALAGVYARTLAELDAALAAGPVGYVRSTPSCYAKHITEDMVASVEFDRKTVIVHEYTDVQDDPLDTRERVPERILVCVPQPPVGTVLLLIDYYKEIWVPQPVYFWLLPDSRLSTSRSRHDLPETLIPAPPGTPSDAQLAQFVFGSCWFPQGGESLSTVEMSQLCRECMDDIAAALRYCHESVHHERRAA